MDVYAYLLYRSGDLNRLNMYSLFTYTLNSYIILDYLDYVVNYSNQPHIKQRLGLLLEYTMMQKARRKPHWLILRKLSLFIQIMPWLIFIKVTAPDYKSLITLIIMLFRSSFRSHPFFRSYSY